MYTAREKREREGGREKFGVVSVWGPLCKPPQRRVSSSLGFKLLKHLGCMACSDGLGCKLLWVLVTEFSLRTVIGIYSA